MVRVAKLRHKARLHRREVIVALHRHRLAVDAEEKELAKVMALPRAEQREERKKTGLFSFSYPAGSWWCEMCDHYNFPNEEKCGGTWRRSFGAGEGSEVVRCCGTKAIHMGGYVRPLEDERGFQNRAVVTADDRAAVLAPHHRHSVVEIRGEDGTTTKMTARALAYQEMMERSAKSGWSCQYGRCDGKMMEAET